MDSRIKIKIKRLSDEFADIPLPEYATAGASGLDVRAAVEKQMVIPAGKISLVPTNLSVEIPFGYEIQVRPRSGLAAKHGIFIPNSPGTIDSDYRGELKIILGNFGTDDFTVSRGDRIAQLVLSKVYLAEFTETKDLNDTHRSEGGFGHTGRK